MDSYTFITVARALHVLGVVLWIGGVAFVTLVLLPAIRVDKNADGMQVFETLEHRFASIAKVSTLLTGVSGLWMLHSLNIWQRYLEPSYWWIHLMTVIWLIFSLILFVFEPWFLHAWFKQQAIMAPAKTMRRLQLMHAALLALSLLAIVAAVCGAHGVALTW